MSGARGAFFAAIVGTALAATAFLVVPAEAAFFLVFLGTGRAEAVFFPEVFLAPAWVTAFRAAAGFAADRFRAASGGSFFGLFLAAFGEALRGAAAFFATALDVFFLLGVLAGAAAFEALLFLPVGFFFTEDAFFTEALTVFAFLFFVAELSDLVALIFLRCDIYVPL